jgi:DNA replication protein DnaC
MAYSNEIYRKAERILESRRDDATMQADFRSAEIKEKLPEIEEIQQKLSRIGLELSKIFFYKGNADERVRELRQQSQALIEQRAIILKKNGWSENAMQPQYVCPVCQDKGFIEGRMCNCHRQLLKDIMRQEISKIAPLDDCTFDNFSLDYYSDAPLDNAIVPRNKMSIIFTNARNYAQNFPASNSNIIFLGNTGLGKTHLSLAIANTVINKGYYVCYGTSQNICDDLQNEQFGRGDEAYYSKAQVLGCDLLILDDLGTEVNNQYTVATIYNIINSRILKKKPTIISTNLEFDELLDKYDQRITSRLTGEYVRFIFVGSDIRNDKDNLRTI